MTDNYAKDKESYKSSSKKLKERLATNQKANLSEIQGISETLSKELNKLGMAITSRMIEKCFDLEKKHKRSQVKKIAIPPGIYLSRIIGFLYSKKTKERVFDPILADMQEEYFEALGQNHLWKMRWVRLRGFISTLHAAFYGFPFSFMRKIVDILKAN